MLHYLGKLVFMRLQTGETRAAFRRAARRTLMTLVATLTVAGLGACTVTTEEAPSVSGQPTPTSSKTPTTPAIPGTDLTVLASDLAGPTDITVGKSGQVILTIGNSLTTVAPDGTKGTIALSMRQLAEIDQPLLSIALPSDFATSGEFYLCYQASHDVRVARMDLDASSGSATQRATLVSGIPVPTDALTGCELAIGPDGYLYVGTSDGGIPQAPQDLASLGGKVLRIDTTSGAAPADNPFVDRSEPNTRLIYSLGHRDITGLAWHPTTGVMFGIDQGPGREDEVNVIVPGGNYGWNPASASTTSYAPSGVPMTDLNIKYARPAAYNSGTSTTGLAAAAFIQGTQWGAWTGNLAITNSNSARITVLPITGEIVGQPSTFEALNLIGPSQAIASDSDGALYLSTGNGQNDRLLRLQAK